MAKVTARREGEASIRPLGAGAAPPEAGLVAEGVRYSAGASRLLDDVSVAVIPGEVLAVVGPNGAGKSTLLRVLAGDLAPQAGRVLLDGRAIGELRAGELARLRAVLPQQSLLQFAFTVREVVQFGRYPRDDGPERDALVVGQALRAAEVEALSERIYPTLSGGEQARVQYARVLAQEARYLLLDEPTAALDIRHQELVLRVARRQTAAGIGVLAILHDLNLAAAHADRIVLLSRGRVAAAGTPWEVFTSERLSAAFEHPIMVTPHPARPCPLIVTGPD